MTWRKRWGAIGLDIGTRAVKAVQVERGGGAVRTAAFLRRELGKDLTAAELGRAMDVLWRQGFEGDAVVLAAPGSGTGAVAATVELPPRLAGAQVRTLARMELARMLKREPGTFELAAWTVPAPARAADATHVMATTLDADAAWAVLDVCDEAGVEVEALEVPALALARAAEGQIGAEGAALHVIVDVGWSATRCVVVHTGGGTPVVVYERVIGDVALRELFAQVQKDHGVEAAVAAELLNAREEAAAAEGGARRDSDMPRSRNWKRVRAVVEQLARELALSLAYTAGRYPDGTRSDGLPVERIWMCGGGADLIELREQMEDHTGVRVGVLGAGGGRMGLALGLALHAEAAEVAA